MDVSVIIVNYNTKQLLGDSLDSIFCHTAGIDFEVIVVDNASTDGSIELFANDQRITFVESGDNLGFGKANNIGAKYAGGKYLFLLNSDTVLTGNAIRKFYDFCETHTELRIGAIGGILSDNTGNATFSYGEFPSPASEWHYYWDGLLRKLRLSNGFKQKKYEEVRKNGYSIVDYVSGANLFMKKSVFDDLNGFDPDFFLYFEETDLQKRLEYAGLNRFMIDNTDIIHLEGMSFTSGKQVKMSFNRYYTSQTSQYIYMSKHFKGISYLLFRLTVCTVRFSMLLHGGFSLNQRIKAIKQTFTK